MKNCTTFHGLLKPLTKKLVMEGTKRYATDYYSKGFKTWEHLLVLIYAQLTHTTSLREIEIGCNSEMIVRQIVGQKVHRSTLSDANERRSAACFFWIAQQLMLGLPRKQHREIGKVVRLLDSSPIQLKGTGYEWAEPYRTLRCQGLKLHVEYDTQLSMPVRMETSYPNTNDCTLGQAWPLIENTVYVFDKGYCDFNWWWKIHQKSSYFVTRLKENTAVKALDFKKEMINEEIILEDHFIELKNKTPRGGKKNLYTERLRRIVVKRADNKKPLVLVSNLLDIPALTIADLYKSRWEIELFFKWIKQKLKIKKYLGRSANAVKLQLASALITYILIALFKALFKKEMSLHHTLIWIKHNLLLEKKIYLTKGPPFLYPYEKSGNSAIAITRYL